MHAISSYRGNRPTNTQTIKQTHRQDRIQYTAPLSLARSVINTLQVRFAIVLGFAQRSSLEKVCNRRTWKLPTPLNIRVYTKHRGNERPRAIHRQRQLQQQQQRGNYYSVSWRQVTWDRRRWRQTLHTLRHYAVRRLHTRNSVSVLLYSRFWHPSSVSSTSKVTYFFTQSSSFLKTCPNHHNLFLCAAFICHVIYDMFICHKHGKFRSVPKGCAVQE